MTCVCWDYETTDAPCTCGAREKKTSRRRRSPEEIRAAARTATIPRWVEPRVTFNPALVAWLNSHGIARADWPNGLNDAARCEASAVVGNGNNLDDLGWPIDALGNRLS